MSIAESKTKEEVKLLKPKNDIVFQCLFNQNNERITKAFVQALIDEKILTDKIEIHIIELAKVRNTYEQNKENKKAQWMLFLDDPNSKEVQEIMKENEEVKEAIVEVHKMTEDEKLQRLADLRQKAIMDEKAYLSTAMNRGFEKGRKEGLEQGLEQRNQEIAEKLLKRNMSIDEVAEITGMSIEAVKEISKKVK